MRIRRPLYNRIMRSMPVFCVDLLVRDARGRVLMLKRANAPMKGQWWLPGGRVLYREPRPDAARRKLREECGLEASALRELGTFDIIVDEQQAPMASHTVATVYEAAVRRSRVRLDAQSVGHRWRTLREWGEELDDAYLSNILRLARGPRRSR